MPPSSIPLIYCETNWIVALAFPHHQHYKGARMLRERAHRGECEIRLPYASILEARHPIVDVSNDLNKAFNMLRDALSNALANGWADADFMAAKAALGGGAMDRYLQRQAPQIIDELLADEKVTLLRDPTSAIPAMDRLRASMNFRGKDVIDLYILAVVVSDRLTEDDRRPAVFFSTNKREFQPRGDAKTQLQTHFYVPYRMLWRDDFALDQGIRHWQEKFAMPPERP